MVSQTVTPDLLIESNKVLDTHFFNISSVQAQRPGKNKEHFEAIDSATDDRKVDVVLKFCAVGMQLGRAGHLTLMRSCIWYIFFVWASRHRKLLIDWVPTHHSFKQHRVDASEQGN